MSNISPDLKTWFRRTAGRALDLLFPPTCVTCGHMGTAFCDACAQRVEAVTAPLCARCGRQTPAATQRCAFCEAEESWPLTKVRSAALHTSPLREAIHALKYEARPDVAPALARYLVVTHRLTDWAAPAAPIDAASFIDAVGFIDAVVPVPLHAQRLAERGYNQSELLADAFCKMLGLDCRPGWIERRHFTRPQVGLNARERQVNVADAFHVHPAAAGRRILLIDDVYTTGATLRSCAAAARVAGAERVFGLTLAQPAGRRGAEERHSSASTSERFEFPGSEFVPR
jgi:ComF family protein